VKTEFKKKFDNLAERVSIIEKQTKENIELGPSRETRTNLNLVIRNLPQREGENVLSKVNGLLKDGLKIRDVHFKSAERKVSRNQLKPGVIIAECESADDKRRILESKRILKDSRNFKDVFIEHDIPASQRILNANLRTIINTLGNNQLELRGSIVRSVYRSSHSNHFGRDHWRSRDRGDQTTREQDAHSTSRDDHTSGDRPNRRDLNKDNRCAASRDVNNERRNTGQTGARDKRREGPQDRDYAQRKGDNARPRR
jgi:hypothetical protein